jgi:hypothetical protein
VLLISIYTVLVSTEQLQEVGKGNKRTCRASPIMQNSASLVKYNTPTLVNTTGGKGGKKNVKKSVEKQSTQTEDILNSILPPR